jgi:hypothetical protein
MYSLFITTVMLLAVSAANATLQSQAVLLLSTYYYICTAYCFVLTTTTVWLVLHRQCPAAFRGVSEQLLVQCALCWREEKRRRKTSSARHMGVSKCLDLMNIEHRNESEHDIDIEVQ